MNKTDKIFIAGASGMVGSAIARNLVQNGYTNLIGSYHSRLLGELKDKPVKMVKIDFTEQREVNNLFEKVRPDYVFLAAAKVGGIYANNTYPAQFIYENLAIQNNIIHASYTNNAKRLLFLGSSCVYPKLTSQPMKEEQLLTGPLEQTNEPYSIAKIAGIKMCESYNRQYGTRFIAVMPTNLYGPNDHFDLENSHVLPALIRKFHEAKKSNADGVKIWGTGSPRREFLHVDDMADACVFAMSLADEDINQHFISYPSPCFINVGTGQDCTIKELSIMIKDQVGFKGEIALDAAKPDGTPQKLLDVSKINNLGWKAKINFKNGIKSLYKWFLREKVLKGE